MTTTRTGPTKPTRFPGERSMLAGILIDSMGTGMYVPFTLLFLDRVTHLPLAAIGAVLTIAGLAGMASLPLSGWAIDRFGARRMLFVGYTVRGLGFAAYPLATSMPVFVVIAVLTAVSASAAPAVQQALTGELTSGGDRDRFLTLGRAWRNGGLGAGGLLAGLIIAVAGDSGFLIAGWLNAASFLGAAVLMHRIPRGAAPTRSVAKPIGYREVLRDRPFLGLTAANFLVSMGYSALSVLLPVYAVLSLGAPPWLIGVLFGVNTALCAFAGVPVGRLAQRHGRRTRVAALGAAVFGASFLGFALLGVLHPGTPWVAAAALLVLTAGYTVGELLHSPPAGALSVAAAPELARGRYLATYQLSWSLSTAVAPSLLTGLLAVDDRLPWLALAVLVPAGGALLIALERRLPADAVSPEGSPKAKRAAAAELAAA
ncbi:MFS transporter [Solihabitans fulvus]|uniref:MFS transporter n=1 Tax=Solihabitans fulvus TaxID=1892852 RepID=A0A5B2XRF5_9PSEU|nr:MFS transporter [Solihabitans fulvus]KAA2265685.1 MFS transporter [Solihabitans fulvus]